MPLTDNGREQAGYAGEFLKDKEGHILKKFNDTSFLKGAERRTEDF
ncbi:MAG: hypothetical protein JSW28_00350 [Thermoplasmata archaeon]|nr:MAG: hypothetical protein JSW28_00350 [Thermoplasmata archaeon]